MAVTSRFSLSSSKEEELAQRSPWMVVVMVVVSKMVNVSSTTKIVNLQNAEPLTQEALPSLI